MAKIDPSGTALVYSGFLGGSADEVAHGIAVDGAGNAYVVGRTGSSAGSFPETVGPDLIYNGGSYDAFVAKVDAAGAALVYCGYLGGTGDDVAHAVALDSSGNAYLTGNTGSSAGTFPETVGPDLTYNGGFNDAFVAKVDAGGAGLVYCGYHGGSAEDGGYGIAVDAAGAAYVTGITNSTQAQGFPLVAGPDLTYNGGLFDTWVSKVKPVPNDPAPANNFFYSGYIGGLGDDPATAIAIDSAGSAYVVGRTASSEASFPVVVGPDLTFGGSYDVFVTKVKPTPNDAVPTNNFAYSGYIGGSGDDFGTAVAVDGAGRAFVTGSTESSAAQGFPVAGGPDLIYNGGTSDAFVATIDGPALDLAIAKTDGQTSAVPGLAVSYTITVTNNGPDTVTSLFVNDAVPAAITGAGFTPSTGAYDPGTGEWTGLNLAATQSVVLTLSGTIDPFARVSVMNSGHGVAASGLHRFERRQRLRERHGHARSLGGRAGREERRPRPGTARGAPDLHAHGHQQRTVGGDERERVRRAARRHGPRRRTGRDHAVAGQLQLQRLDADRELRPGQPRPHALRHGDAQGAPAGPAHFTNTATTCGPSRTPCPPTTRRPRRQTSSCRPWAYASSRPLRPASGTCSSGSTRRTWTTSRPRSWCAATASPPAPATGRRST